MIAAVIQRERGGDLGQGNGADAGFAQRLQFAIAFSAGLPQAELFEGRVVFVDPAVVVGVERGQFGKTVAAGGAEQFAAVVDPAILITVEAEVGATAGELGYLFLDRKSVV